MSTRAHSGAGASLPAASTTATVTMERGRARFRTSAARFRIEVASDGSRAIEIAFSQGRLLVGSGPACALRLDGEGVSRRHLALQVDDHGLRVEDLRSKNGTYLSGIRVSDAHCVGGEEIDVGGVTLQVSFLGAASADDEMRFGWGPLVGASAQMRRLYGRFDALAESPLVLVEGERGTGKSMLARALLRAGEVEPLVVYGASDAELTELGALTEASTALVIEDVDALAPSGQSALASLLAERRDVHVVATTSRDLDVEVEQGRFDEGLARLLLEWRVELPPLRDRVSDIALLVAHLEKRFGAPEGTVSPRIVAAFAHYTWPANVSELEQAVRTRVELAARLSEIAEGHASADDEPGLETQFADLLAPLRPYSDARDELLARFGEVYCARALSQSGGEAAAAARSAGVTLRYFNVLRARARREKAR